MCFITAWAVTGWRDTYQKRLSKGACVCLCVAMPLFLQAVELSGNSCRLPCVSIYLARLLLSITFPLQLLSRALSTPRGRFCCKANAISIHRSQTTETRAPHLSTEMEFLSEEAPAQYTFEIRRLNMRLSDFGTPGVIPKWQKMEGVACVKMKGIQKRHSTGVWILKHAGLVVQFSDSA